MIVKNKGEVNSEDIEFDPFKNHHLEHPDVLSSQQTYDVVKKMKESTKVNTGKASVEYSYAKYVEESHNLSVGLHDESATLYRWGGSYWKAQSEHDSKQEALHWLKTMAIEKASAKVAGECYRTALLMGKPLPPRTTGTIIPFKDNCLRMNNDFSFEVVPPQRKDGITYQINAEIGDVCKNYQPSELPDDSLFKKYLETSLPDIAVRDIIQEYSGYTLLGDTRFQKMLVNTGDGSNGKSVYLKIITALHQKVTSIRLDKLDGFGTYGLKDASLAIAAEAPKRGLNEEILKACISGDKITLEGKFKNQFEYSPTAKWIVACNRFPKIQDESNGMWRRVIIVDWKVVIDENSKDMVLNLGDKIVDNELIHVVNWCLIGLQRLLKRGKFDVPESVAKALEREKEKSNSVIPFVSDYEIDYTTDQATAKDTMYTKYREYCEAQGFIPYGNAEFWTRMKAKFPKLKEERRRTHGIVKRYVFLAFNQTSSV